MQGTLYGVGIGPGDAELLTLKAVRIIQEADCIAVPGMKKEETVAWQITIQAVPEIAGKECLEIHMPMTKDKEELQKSHEAAAEQVAAALAAGKNVAFLTLGDPCIYSTYLYVHKRILAMGYPAAIISGIPSFCAAAADEHRAGGKIGAAACYSRFLSDRPDALKLPGTKVLMKAGRKMRDVKQQLQQMDNAETLMIENCGMPGEKLYYGAEEIPETAGYYSLIIVKERD